MHSGLIGKVQKARQYSQAPERVRISDFSAHFEGEHGSHRVAYHQSSWICSCNFFSKYLTCSHTMAMERMLSGMFPE